MGMLSLLPLRVSRFQEQQWTSLQNGLIDEVDSSILNTADDIAPLAQRYTIINTEDFNYPALDPTYNKRPKTPSSTNF